MRLACCWGAQLRRALAGVSEPADIANEVSSARPQNQTLPSFCRGWTGQIFVGSGTSCWRAWRDPAPEDTNNILAPWNKARGQRERPWYSVSLWTTRTDMWQLELCATQTHKALASPHLGDRALEGLLLNDHAQKSDEQGSSKVTGIFGELQAFAHTLSWLEDEHIHHISAEGSTAWAQQEYAPFWLKHPFWLKFPLCPLCNAHGPIAAVCLSSVPDGISMSRVSATLQRALSFKAVEIALRSGIQQPAAERVVEVPRIPCQEFFEAVKDVTQERISEQTETSGQNRPLQRAVDPAQIMEEKFEVHTIVAERILQTAACTSATGDRRENWGCTSITGWEDACTDRGCQGTRDCKPRPAFAANSGAAFCKDV